MKRALIATFCLLNEAASKSLSRSSQWRSLPGTCHVGPGVRPTAVRLPQQRGSASQQQQGEATQLSDVFGAAIHTHGGLGTRWHPTGTCPPKYIRLQSCRSHETIRVLRQELHTTQHPLKQAQGKQQLQENPQPQQLQQHREVWQGTQNSPWYTSSRENLPDSTGTSTGVPPYAAAAVHAAFTAFADARPQNLLLRLPPAADALTTATLAAAVATREGGHTPILLVEGRQQLEQCRQALEQLLQQTDLTSSPGHTAGATGSSSSSHGVTTDVDHISSGRSTSSTTSSSSSSSAVGIIPGGHLSDEAVAVIADLHEVAKSLRHTSYLRSHFAHRSAIAIMGDTSDAPIPKAGTLPLVLDARHDAAGAAAFSPSHAFNRSRRGRSSSSGSAAAAASKLLHELHFDKPSLSRRTLRFSNKRYWEAFAEEQSHQDDAADGGSAHHLTPAPQQQQHEWQQQQQRPWWYGWLSKPGPLRHPADQMAVLTQPDHHHQQHHQLPPPSPSDHHHHRHHRHGHQSLVRPELTLQLPVAAAGGWGLLPPAEVFQVQTGCSMEEGWLHDSSSSSMSNNSSTSSSSSSSPGRHSSKHAEHAATAAPGVDSSKSGHHQHQQLLGVNPSLPLPAALLSPERITAVVQAYQNHGNRRKGLVYALDANHARALAVALSLKGFTSSVLHELQPVDEQQAVLGHFWGAPGDLLLVTSETLRPDRLPPAAAAAGGVECVMMAAPVVDKKEYAARIELGLLPAAGKQSLVVIDMLDNWVGEGCSTGSTSGALDAIGMSSSSSTGSSVRFKAVRCSDVLPPSVAEVHPPVPAAAGAGSPAAADDDAVSRHGTESDLTESSVPPADADSSSLSSLASSSGDLTWSVLGDGTWGVTLKKKARPRKVGGMSGRRSSNATAAAAAAAAAAAREGSAATAAGGSQEAIAAAVAAMTGERVLWLRLKRPGAYVPEVTSSDGQVVLLRPSGRGMTLQRARKVAEAWLKKHEPDTYELYDEAAEWRSRPLSPAQATFFLRHEVPYQQYWTRGQAHAVQVKWRLEEMRHPVTEHQQFLLSHLSHFAPGHVAGQMRRTTPYRSTANLLIQTALTGGATTPLPARQAVLDDLEAVWEAGLKQLRYSWIVLPGGKLLLDLMNGCYLWLVPAEDPAAAAIAADNDSSDDDDDDGSGAADDDADAGSLAGGKVSSPSSSSDNSSDDRSDTSSSSSSGAGAGRVQLNPDQLYQIMVQRSDGSMVPVTAGARKPRVIFQLPTFHPAGKAKGSDISSSSSSSSSTSLESGGNSSSSSITSLESGGDGSGSSNATSSSAPTTATPAPPAPLTVAAPTAWRSGPPPTPLPLHVAAVRAEGMVQRWALQKLVLVSQGHQMRVTGMLGGWSVPSKQAGVLNSIAAAPQQLDALAASSLPTSPRYSSLDAARELLRHTKSKGLPEAPATASQLARMREIQLLLGDSGDAAAAVATAGLTAAQARYVLYITALQSEEAADRQLAEAMAAKKKRTKGLYGMVGPVRAVMPPR